MYSQQAAMNTSFQGGQYAAAAVHQENSSMVWNGSQWVAATPGYAAPSVGLYQSQQPQSNVGYTAPRQPQQAPNAHLVQMYTQYYYQYTALKEGYLKDPTGQQHAVWAESNANLASAAAHFFNANPTALSASHLTLPPPPPAYLLNGPTSVSSQSAATSVQPLVEQTANPYSAQTYQNSGPQIQYSGQPQNLGQQLQSFPLSTPSAQPQASAPSTATTGQDANDKMKRFLDRCLSRCGDSTENKKYVIKQFELMLAAEMKKGSLRSVDWDSKPLIEIPQQREVVQLQPSTFNDRTVGTLQRQHVGNQDDYYGPSSSEPIVPSSSAFSGNFSMSRSTMSKRRKGNQRMFDRRSSSTSSNHDSYYGPTETNTFDQPDHSFESEDFISIPAPSKKYKAVQNTGFAQTDAALSSRANRFRGKGGFVRDASTLSLAKTSSGEWDRYMGKTTIGGTNKKLDEVDYEQMTIRGTCQVLEKDYLRLTAPPKAELVRPLPILEQHLQNLKQDRSRKLRDYLWYCS
jgi:hypothetical protein